MRQELTIKEVDFYGDEIMCVQDISTGKIYVGVSWICNGIGLNKSQKDTQVQKIQRDLALKLGCLKFQAGVFDDNNETISIELDYLPLWLAKISITPKMQEENPILASKLVTASKLGVLRINKRISNLSSLIPKCHQKSYHNM